MDADQSMGHLIVADDIWRVTILLRNILDNGLLNSQSVY